MEDKQLARNMSAAQNGYSQSATTTAAPLHYATSNTNEWYTPRLYMDAVREVFRGRIALDPASCEKANEVVGAERYYTKAEDGLSQPWDATTVFLNPPHGRRNGSSQAGVWTHRLISEYMSGNVGEAILLVCSSTSEQWFQSLYNYPICFANRRIHFYGGKGNSPLKGSAFVYLGTHRERFAYIFSENNIGRVVATL